MKNSYFEQHKTGTITIIVIVLIVIGVWLWMGNKNASNSDQLTEEEKAAIIKSTSGTGEGQVFSEKEATEVTQGTSGSASNGTPTFNEEQKQDVVNSMSGK